MKALKFVTATAVMASFSLQAFAASESTPVTANNVIAGRMNIDFQTRREQNQDQNGNPKEGVKDLYVIPQDAAIKVLAGTKCEISFDGRIVRTPLIKGLLGSLLGSRVGNKQDAGYKFDINMVHPKAGPVGVWSGSNMVNEKGVYSPEQGGNKISLTKGKLTGEFPLKGFVYGKAPAGQTSSFLSQASNVISQITSTGAVKKTTLTKADPIGFENLSVSGAPNFNCSDDVVYSGYLVYSYDSGNWYPQDLRIKNTQTGKDDVVTGSIKWIKGEHGGSYDFNLMINQAATMGVKDDQFGSAVETKEGADDDQFSADNSISALTGKMTYEDTTVPVLDPKTGSPVMEDGEAKTTTLASKVTYSLNANKLTSSQIYAFYKMLMIGVGPMNDD